jgi:hypothetical protein
VREGSVLDGRILPGSANVGHRQADGVPIFDEGNAYGAESLHNCLARAKTAAGRAFQSDPTTVKMLVIERPTHLMRVRIIDRRYELTLEVPWLVAQCGQPYGARTERHGRYVGRDRAKRIEDGRDPRRR